MATPVDCSLTFIGTATTVLRLGDFTVLTDPNFLHKGQRVYLGYGLSSKRLTEPAMQPEDLPPLDALVLSHLHGDHFDRIAKDRLARNLPVVTTGHAARRLERWGFRETRAVDSWQAAEFEKNGQRLRVTACPGQHGPGLMRHLLPPVMGSIIELERDGAPTLRLYVTGDTLCRPYLREVAERFPDLDGMIIHVGGTRVLGVLVTMDGPQGADLVEMIAPPVTVPVHYDDYTVFKAPLSDFTSEVKRRGLSTAMRTVGRGETVTLPTRVP